MNRPMVSGNKVLARRERERQQKVHEERIRSMKPSIDNKPPPVYEHMIVKKKRDQLLEERYTAIERENHKLLTRMTDIMSKNTFASLQSAHDAELAHMRTANRMQRQKKLDKISEDNMMMLKRIQEKQPYYDRREWMMHQRTHDSLLTQLREFPYQPEKSPRGVEITSPAPVPARHAVSAQGARTASSAALHSVSRTNLPAVRASTAAAASTAGLRPGVAASSASLRPGVAASSASLRSGARPTPATGSSRPVASQVQRAATAAAPARPAGNTRQVASSQASRTGSSALAPPRLQTKIDSPLATAPSTSVASPFGFSSATPRKTPSVSWATASANNATDASVAVDGRRLHQSQRRFGDRTVTLSVQADTPSSTNASARVWHVSAFDASRTMELALEVKGAALLAAISSRLPEDEAAREEFLVDALVARLQLDGNVLSFRP